MEIEPEFQNARLRLKRDTSYEPAIWAGLFLLVLIGSVVPGLTIGGWRGWPYIAENSVLLGAIVVGLSIMATGLLSFLLLLNLSLSRTAESVAHELAAAKTHVSRGREIANRIETRLTR